MYIPEMPPCCSWALCRSSSGMPRTITRGARFFGAHFISATGAHLSNAMYP